MPRRQKAPRGKKPKSGLSKGREARMRAILDTVIDGIITIDELGIIQSFNPAAERIFGYRAREAIGQTVGILMPEPDKSQHDRYLRNYLEGGTARIIGIGREVVGRRKDGTTFPMHLGVGEASQGRDRRMFVGIVRDLSEFKRLQEELVRTRELAALGEMAVSVAHQLRNPVAAISGAIQVLHESGAVKAPGQVVSDLLDRASRLDQIVKRLLLFARPWKPEKQLFNLAEIVREVITAARTQKTFRNIRFHMDGNPELQVAVDLVLVKEALWNLLDNAAHAMPEGGKVEFIFGESPDAAWITVMDTGRGIPPEDLAQLFRPFFSTKTHGSGLGLVICQKIMDAHGGTISLSSQPGRGTRVRLDFPKK